MALSQQDEQLVQEVLNRLMTDPEFVAKHHLNTGVEQQMQKVASGYENAHKRRKSRNGRKDALRESVAARSVGRSFRSDSSQDTSRPSRLGVISMAGDGYRF